MEWRSPDRQWLLIFVLVFLAVPLILTYSGLNEFWLEYDEFRHKNLEFRLEEVLSSLEANQGTIEFFSDILLLAEKKIFSGDQPAKNQKRIASGLKKKYPGILEFTFLDSDGKPVPELCDGPVPKFFLTKFFKSYKDFLDGKIDSMEKENGFIKTFLGPFVPCNKTIHGTVIYASPKTTRKCVYISSPHPGGMFIVHFNQVPEWELIGLQTKIKLMNSREASQEIFLNDESKPDSLFQDRFRLSEQKSSRVLKKFSESLVSTFWEKDELWGHRSILPGVSLVGRSKISGTWNLQETRAFYFILMTIIWLSLAAVCTLLFTSKNPIYLSVRMKLILAFLYTAGIPLLVMGITARNYLSERRNTLETRLHKNLERSMSSFDRAFPKGFFPLQNDMQKAFVKFVYNPSGPISDLASQLRSYKKAFYWDILKVFDERGKILLEDSEETSRSRETGEFKAFNKFTKTILEKLNDYAPLSRDSQKTSSATNPLNAGELPTPPASSTLKLPDKSTEESPELEILFSKLSKELGKISYFDLGEGKFFISILPIFDSAGRGALIAYLIWSRNRLEQEYVSRNLRKFENSLGETSVFAYHRKNSNLSFPGNFRFRNRVDRFLGQIHSSTQSAKARIVSSDTALLLTGIRGEELSQFSLVAVSSDREIRLELQRMAWRFGTTGLAIILISATVGTILARKFLRPVGNLSAGVNDLRNRNFNRRIEVLDEDELGHLSEAFNNMLEGLADLEVARTVQETLFPTQPLSCGTWEVFGSCQSASQVGGDYFDYFTIDENRLAVVIGDVSGHGVSAALVMAMAKAIIAHPGNELEPGKMLTSMQTVLLSTLKRKKMMTCFFGILDLKTGILFASNAGQNYPYLIRSGEASTLEVPGRPLGTGSKRKFSTMEIPLRNDDAIIFYTDGFVEAMDQQQNMIGYEKVRLVLPSLIRSSALTTEASLREWHRSLSNPEKPADDISLVVLQTVSPAAAI